MKKLCSLEVKQKRFCVQAHTFWHVNKCSKDHITRGAWNLQPTGIFLVLVFIFLGNVSIYLWSYIKPSMGFPSNSVVKNLPVNIGDRCSVLGSWRYPGEGNGNPLQYSCLWNPIWTEEPCGSQSMGLQKSWTWLRN